MIGDDDMRFSDGELVELKQQLKSHIEHEDAWRIEQDARWERVLSATESNTKAVGILIEETRDIVQLHKDLQGAARLGQKLQNMFIWLMKWGAIGTAIAGAIHYIVNHVKP